MINPNYIFDRDELKKELDEFGTLLKDNTSLKERDDILKFFSERNHLSAFIGRCNGKIDRIDYVKREFSLFRKYIPDLVVGQIDKAQYTFVEFEDASENSIFTSPTNSGKTSWAPRFGAGIGQLSDWMMEIDSQKNQKSFHTEFGAHEIDIELMLVIGREQFFIDDQLDRIKCFSRSVKIYGKNLSVYTFDSLFEALSTKFETNWGELADEINEDE